jgi:hypothetical protein
MCTGWKGVKASKDRSKQLREDFDAKRKDKTETVSTGGEGLQG